MGCSINVKPCSLVKPRGQKDAPETPAPMHMLSSSNKGLRQVLIHSKIEKYIVNQSIDTKFIIFDLTTGTNIQGQGPVVTQYEKISIGRVGDRNVLVFSR